MKSKKMKTKNKKYKIRKKTKKLKYRKKTKKLKYRKKRYNKGKGIGLPPDLESKFRPPILYIDEKHSNADYLKQFDKLNSLKQEKLKKSEIPTVNGRDIPGLTRLYPILNDAEFVVLNSSNSNKKSYFLVISPDDDKIKKDIFEYRSNVYGYNYPLSNLETQFTEDDINKALKEKENFSEKGVKNLFEYLGKLKI